MNNSKCSITQNVVTLRKSFNKIWVPNFKKVTTGKYNLRPCIARWETNNVDFLFEPLAKPNGNMDSFVSMAQFYRRL